MEFKAVLKPIYYDWVTQHMGGGGCVINRSGALRWGGGRGWNGGKMRYVISYNPRQWPWRFNHRETNLQSFKISFGLTILVGPNS